MRYLFDVWLVSSFIWGVAVAQYSSCHFDDYSTVMIDEGMQSGRYLFLGVSGLCPRRGDVSLRLIAVRETDTNGDFFVNFPDERGRPIRNQLNTAPFCIAFTIGNVLGSSVLMEADNGTPMLTISPNEVEFSIGEGSVSFNLTGIDVNSRVQRLQVCTDGTDATFYLNCQAMETKSFVLPSSGVNYVSILGQRNLTTLEYTNIFEGSVQQLYTLQCTDSRADLKVLSLMQCLSIPGPAHDDDSGTGCSNPAERNLTALLNEVISDFPTPPAYMKAFCDVIIWRNTRTIPPTRILGHDLKFINTKSGREIIRRTSDYDTFYVLNRTTDECLMQDGITVQVRTNLTSSELFDPFSSFSPPIDLGCKALKSPRVYLEMNGTMYSAGSKVPITAVGEGEDALLCKTDKNDCCARRGSRFGEFYYPNGVTVPIYSHGHSFYRNRGDGVVRLNKRAEVLPVSSEDEPLPLAQTNRLPLGEYCCKVPDACGDVQRVCINLV